MKRRLLLLWTRVGRNFKCFGCGEGGSAITFVMKMENLGFADTVRRLAEKAGISIVEEVYDAAEERRRKARTALLVAHKKAAGFFHRLLLCSPKAAEARAYLKFPRIRGRHGETLAGRVGS